MAALERGRRVVLRYRLTLADGTPVDASADGEPLAFTLGDGTLDRGLEARLLGLCAGDRVTFYLGPGEAFGMPDPEAVHLLPRSDFPPAMALAAGSVVEFTAPSGLAVAGTVVDAGDAEVRVDFSHPLAGRALVFKVAVLAVDGDNAQETT